MAAFIEQLGSILRREGAWLGVQGEETERRKPRGEPGWGGYELGRQGGGSCRELSEPSSSLPQCNFGSLEVVFPLLQIRGVKKPQRATHMKGNRGGKKGGPSAPERHYSHSGSAPECQVVLR